jgi:alpha-glucosidase
MQWDSSSCAGFTDEGVTPWLPVADGYAHHNVAQQDQDPYSMLQLYRRLISLRQAEPSLHVGRYEPVDTKDEDLYAYIRSAPGVDRFLIILNLGSRSHNLDLGVLGPQAQVAVATGLDRRGQVDLAALLLGPDEGLVLRLV